MRDWCFTPECLEKFLQLLPNAHVHRIKKAGHWVVKVSPNITLSFDRDESGNVTSITRVIGDQERVLPRKDD